jgi:SAM-dependent methyltransferase
VTEGDGAFAREKFELLAQVEQRSFWFRGRNRLITWALGRYFPRAKSLLEIGVGTGFVLSAVAESFPALRLVAADASADGLEFVARRVPQAETQVLDIRELPYRNEFDVIGAFDVLEHIAEDELALHSIHAAVAPGGGLLLTVPQHPRLWSANDEYGGHHRRYRRRELVDKVRRAGFAVERVTSFVSTLLPAMMVSRARQRVEVEEFDPTREFNIDPRLDVMLERTLGVELALISRGVSLPAGGSLLLVGKKA